RLARIHPSPPPTYTLSLHDALPICPGVSASGAPSGSAVFVIRASTTAGLVTPWLMISAATPATCGDAIEVPSNADSAYRSKRGEDRKSTRLNSSHVKISYAVFCLKK